MLKKYPVYCAASESGTVQVKKEGLYFCFEGRFNAPKNKIWRIIASSQDQKVDLGICLFDGDDFVLKKRIPVKRFSGDDWFFEAICPADRNKKLVSVLENDSFEQLDALEQAKLVIEDGESAIILDTDH